MISVDFSTPHPFVVGQEVRGVVTWDPRGVTRARALVVTAGWRTEGRGDVDKGTVATLNFPFPPSQFPQGQPTTITQFPFAFRLPLAGPVTYHGRLLRILWALEVRIDIALALDPKQSFPFVVSPRLL